jgi:arginyl-tRNA synthetase
MIKGKMVEIVEKSPEERMENFIKTINHESNRVSEWMDKLLKHTTSTAYPLSDEAIQAILDRINQDYDNFMVSVDKFKSKGSKAPKTQLLDSKDVLPKE